MAVSVRTYPAPAWDMSEVLRYTGMRESAREFESILQSCVDEIAENLTYKVCYRTFRISERNDGIDLGFALSASKDVRRILTGCDRVTVFAATVGLAVDRAILRYSTLSPARALAMQAIGAERVEALCDAFCREMAEEVRREDCVIHPRFSPGYGDIPLSLQTDIFAILDCPRTIGVCLNDSLLMSPSKSVTALMGISRRKENLL